MSANSSPVIYSGITIVLSAALYQRRLREVLHGRNRRQTAGRGSRTGEYRLEHVVERKGRDQLQQHGTKYYFNIILILNLITKIISRITDILNNELYFGGYGGIQNYFCSLLAEIIYCLNKEDITPQITSILQQGLLL
ncbi:Hypothetical_protein [Hexamita inflata]|uniref:Hypothetical_protein n=1 Tax=Hexamita inflata TaxID=28002 RepID=A0AA86TS03_9EUKA|nr:Hypothetical protein HINF_LOCUS14474 [Hexamita inflata]